MCDSRIAVTIRYLEQAIHVYHHPYVQSIAHNISIVLIYILYTVYHSIYMTEVFTHVCVRTVMLSYIR